MLQPKRTKFRKMQKGRLDGKAQRGSTLSFGSYGLQTLETTHITARQIEAARIAMTRHVKRGGRIWIRLFPDKPMCKKPAEVRMGKGRGLARILGGARARGPESSTRWMASPTMSLAKRFVWPPRSCPVKPG